jgi:hypothetical protein
MIEIGMLKIIITSGSSAIGVINKGMLNQRLSAIDKHLSELIKKQDQMITREIKSAFDSINDAISTENEKTREKRLDFAEDNLLKNTRLDINLQTDEKPNGYWICLANFGLSFVCGIRNDAIIGIKHLIKSFEADATLAREIYPDFFATVLEKRTNEIDKKWYDANFKTINEKDYSMDVFWKKAGAILTGAGAVVGAILLKTTAPMGSLTQEATKMGNEATTEILKEKALKSLNEERIEKFNIFCREAALEALELINKTSNESLKEILNNK